MSESERHVYVVRYALTQGIKREKALHGDAQRRTSYVRTGRFSYLTPGRECFDTFPEAHAAALGLRDKKIAALERQIAKLRTMTFEEPT